MKNSSLLKRGRIIRRLELRYTLRHGIWLSPVLILPKGWRGPA